jgi:hypothetical protein
MWVSELSKVDFQQLQSKLVNSAQVLQINDVLMTSRGPK